MNNDLYSFLLPASPNNQATPHAHTETQTHTRRIAKLLISLVLWCLPISARVFVNSCVGQKPHKKSLQTWMGRKESTVDREGVEAACGQCGVVAF